MATLGYLAAPLLLIVLNALAAHFGRDSRDGIEVPPRPGLGSFR